MTLQFYTSRIMYLQSLVEGAGRVDLDGNVCGEVTASDAEHARSRIAGIMAARDAKVAAAKAASKVREATGKAAKPDGPDCPGRTRNASRGLAGTGKWHQEAEGPASADATCVSKGGGIINDETTRGLRTPRAVYLIPSLSSKGESRALYLRPRPAANPVPLPEPALQCQAQTPHPEFPRRILLQRLRAPVLCPPLPGL